MENSRYLPALGMDFRTWAVNSVTRERFAQYGLYKNNPYVIEDGHIVVSDAPGWDVEIDSEWLDSATYQVSEIA